MSNTTISGTSGHDTLPGVGSQGPYVLVGGTGDDTYIVTDSLDEVIELADEGTDLVRSSIEYTLGDNVENLTLTGQAVTGAGNALDNVLQANSVFLYHVGGGSGTGGGLTNTPSFDVYQGSNLSGGAGRDTLIGGAGLDTLAGGLGDDVYEIQAIYPMAYYAQLVENADEGIDEVRLSLGGSGFVLPDHIENLTLVDDIYTKAGSGNSQDNVIQGNSWANTLVGAAGRDTLVGGGGDDTLVGGLDGDVLDGGEGADHYRFARGDGQDLIHADAMDTLVLDGYSRSDIVVGAQGASSVVLSFKGSSDTITLDNAGQWDGLTLSVGGLSSGVTGADLVSLARGVSGRTISGTWGKDTLLGGVGNDTLSGLAGADTLYGGPMGNDRLIGGKGNDSYQFGRGDGQDTIVDQDGTWFNSDLLSIHEASSDQLWLARSGNNLNINVIGTSDKVTIEGWYASSSNRVEKITALGDGKTLSHTKVNALVTAMAAFAPPAEGQTTLPADVQSSLNKVLASSWA